MADYELIFRDADEARDVTLELLEGEVPAGLRGRFLRNGPGIQRAGKDPMHFLDGHGIVAGASFEAGRVRYDARLVDTPLLRKEREAGRMLARRPFTNLPGGRWKNFLKLKFAAGAGHDVYVWGGRVVPCDVTGHYLMDPTTLDTLGPAPLNGELHQMENLAAMPRVDPHTGRLVSYVVKPGVLGDDTVTFVEYDDAWRECARVTRAIGAKGALLHDIAVSQNHYVVAEFARAALGPTALGTVSAAGGAHLPENGPSRMLVIPRKGDGPLRELPLPAGHQTFHVFNAYEEGGALVVDATIYEGVVDFKDLYPEALRAEYGTAKAVKGPFVVRHTMDLATGKTTRSMIEGVRGESPSVRADKLGTKHRYGYLSAPTSRGDEPTREAYFWFHGVGKVDFEARTMSTWDAGPRVYLSAPQFVPRGEGEDDGWLLAWAHDAAKDRGEVVILDAKDLARGPLARLALPRPLPPASHCAWMPA